MIRMPKHEFFLIYIIKGPDQNNKQNFSAKANPYIRKETTTKHIESKPQTKKLRKDDKPNPHSLRTTDEQKLITRCTA